MNGFLLDTSVLSALAPDRPPLGPELRDWILAQGERETLFTSAIVVEELQKGLSRLRRIGALARADRLEKWLDEIMIQFGERILPVTGSVARLAGKLEDAATAKGRNPGLADVLIAATAEDHGLAVATANTRHFAVLGIRHFDPTAGDLPEL